MQRRAFTLGLVAATLVPLAAHATDFDTDLASALSAIEVANKGKLLVGIVDEKGRRFEYGTRRFPLSALRRPLLAALVLQQMEEGRLSPEEVVRLDRGAHRPASPHTAAHITEGMTLLALAEAVVSANDDLATRLLIEKVGGAHTLTAWLQQHVQGITVDDNGALRSTVAGAADAVASVFLRVQPQLTSMSRTLLNQWLQAASPNSWRVARTMNVWRPASIAPTDDDQVDLVVVTPSPNARAVVVVAWKGKAPVPVLRKAGEAIGSWLAG